MPENTTGTSATLAAPADGYPCFIQLHGEAAWDVVAASGERRLHDGHVPEVPETFQASRSAYYGARVELFRRQGPLSLARDVALAFHAAPTESLGFAALTEVLSRHGDRPVEPEDFPGAKGYIVGQRPVPVSRRGLPGREGLHPAGHG